MLSAKRLFLPLFLSAVCACALSLPALPKPPQDQSQEKAPEKSASEKGQDPKDKNAKTAKKQTRDEDAAKLPTVIWRDPGDIASLDLVNGQGGAEHAPRPDAEYTFVKEDTNGTSAKFYAKDNDGVE